ncbi:S-layer homology domain-containing protein [Alteribacillus sp. JSM 102045]|uniref:S-layer homology domain-containing protein n=1 Tax=Alteribacillus sp. JSM 102045 TaxID=1562101 RepID=UPI0035BFCE0C
MKVYSKSILTVLAVIGLSGSAAYLAVDKNAKAEEAQPVEEEKEAYQHPSKSIGFYIGKERTEDGSTILAGFGHEPSSHWIDIVPAQEHEEGATIEVGATEEARLPGELTEIPQVKETSKYISSSYSEFAGFPPPLTNGGLNEHGVAARDIWSPSREELVEMTPDPQTGPQYSDLARIAMERATSAREAVEIIGGLIDEYGFTTYGGNSHLFADENEGWILINYAGGQGLWAAKRLGSDEIRVSYPGYINEFAVDFEDNENYMASSNLLDFAEEQGWWEPDEDEEYVDLQEIYGTPFPGEGVSNEDDHYTAARMPHEREEELEEMGELSLEDMMAHVRDPRWSNDFSGYGQVAHIRPDVEDELQTLWLATTGSITTPYVPIPIATEEVPPEFLQHRYMTKDADSDFLAEEYAHQEATRSAVRQFKRLMYYTCEHPKDFLHDVIGEIESFEMEMLAERDELEAEAQALYKAGKDNEAQELITENVQKRLLESLDLGMELTIKVEEETRERYGIRLPEGSNSKNGETTPASSKQMTGGNKVTCYAPELDEYPREFGIYSEENEEPSDIPNFSDVTEGHFAYDSIKRLAAEEVIKGYSDGMFRPNDEISREHVAVMLTRAFELDTSDVPDLPGSAGVSKDHKYYDEIAAMYEEGWMGLGDEGFRPDEMLTRGQMALVLQRAYDLPVEETEAEYRDVSEDHWAYEGIAAITVAGIADGYEEDNTFRASNPTTRAQLTVFLDSDEYFSKSY